MQKIYEFLAVREGLNKFGIYYKIMEFPTKQKDKLSNFKLIREYF